jgi:hypothetical protein
LENTAKLISLSEELSKEDKDELIEYLPAIITETPETPLAVVKLQTTLTKVAKSAGDALVKFGVQHGCEYVVETIKKYI